MTFFKWVRTYPMTAIMIVVCLVGCPYFAVNGIFEKWQAYNSQVICVDGMGAFTSERKLPAFISADVQRTLTEHQEEVAEKLASFHKVKTSYLEDAVFIGDSRTDTLRLYSGWDMATYYCKTGTNIWAILGDEVVEDKESGRTLTVEQGLEKFKFGKVYIMLGVNELGTGSAETYYQQFKSVVERIRELQPEAVIFVQSIMHVTAAKDAEGTAINNKNINERNHWLEKLADGKSIFYLDENEVLDDENGCLKSDSTFDGVHLKADKVGPWKKFILGHGIELIKPIGSSTGQE